MLIVQIILITTMTIQIRRCRSGTPAKAYWEDVDVLCAGGHVHAVHADVGIFRFAGRILYTHVLAIKDRRVVLWSLR